MRYLILTMIYAFLNRFRGSSQTMMPRQVVCAAMALPFALVVPWAYSLPNWIITTMALVTAHGIYDDLGTWKWIQGSAKLDFLINWIKPHVSGYLYDFIGLSMTGVIVTLPTGILLLDWRVAIMGVGKGSCYAVARNLSTKYPVELGEILTGALYGFTLAMSHTWAAYA